MTRRSKVSLVGIILVLTAGTATWAHMDPGEGRLLPYEGHLDLDGAPQTGTFDFRFALFGSPSADASCMGASSLTCSSALWSEGISNVAVSQGKFGVTLGQNTTLGDSVFASPDLYLAIAVRKGTDGFAVLQGMQRLLAVPFAARAAAAKNYTVSGTLTVGGDVQIAGSVLSDLKAGSNVSVAKDLTLSGVLKSPAGLALIPSGARMFEGVDASGTDASKATVIGGNLRMVYGRLSVPANTYRDITNLGFADANFIAFGEVNGMALAGYNGYTLGTAEVLDRNTVRLHNQDDGTRVVNWYAIGTVQ